MNCRYNAACVAALAGCGMGKDAESLDAAARARLRRKALYWLEADLVAWGEELEADFDNTRATVQQTMQHWLQDVDFAGVREPSALLELSEVERRKWQKLWEAVKALVQRAGQPR